MNDRFVIGIDYGTDSVRAVVVDAATGSELAQSVFEYPRWKAGLYCEPSQQRFRQHPLDYVEGLESVVRNCVQQIGAEEARHIKGIAVDTTGSTPVVVDKTGQPLALSPGFSENPNAMFILWKDHTAIAEADELNAHAAAYPTDYLKYVGGIYSSEWFWAKWLHVIREDKAVREAGYSLVEHCDWIPFLLTGGKEVSQMKRSVCAAGHKALFSAEWGGLPPNDFFKSWDPLLDGVVDRLFSTAYTSDIPAGHLSEEWASRLGLSTDIVVAVGAFDAHMGAVGGQIEPYYLSKVMGTSTCDILVAEGGEPLVNGICGQVNGSVIPGMTGLEAGQSAFGDIFAWHSRLVNISIPELSEKAAKLPLRLDDPLAIDWLNGRRTPDADQTLKAALVNLDLGSDAVRIFKAWVEAACFGARAIVERFIEEGVPVKGVIGLGGVARKSPYVMQVLADVLNRPIRIHRSDQTCAMGAAMFAAAASGLHKNVSAAMQAMGQGFDMEYQPDPAKVAFYEKRYENYKTIGGQFSRKPIARSKDPYRLIREEAYEANLLLPQKGLVIATFGNVSSADRDRAVFAIKPSGVPYEELTPESMVVVDFDGKTVDGKYRPSSDTRTHAVLYKEWANIRGICHTHSTYATAWAQSLQDIPLFGTTHADHATVPVPCAAPMKDELIQSDYEWATGWQIIDCLKERGLTQEDIEMILVGNHAPFTWGKNAHKAVYNSEVLEQIAKMALLTRQINPAVLSMKDSLIKKHFERKHGSGAYYGQD